MNILIIEDEMKAAKGLIKTLAEIDDTIRIVAVLESVKDSVKWFAENEQPDLIFSDIQLSDGLCFDIYQNVKVTSPIIFCTAFDEYLMDAFDTCAVSYLLKPINKDKIEEALAKYKSMQATFQDNHIEKLLSQIKPTYKTTLLVNFKDKIMPVQTKDIAFFYWDESVLTLTTLKNHKYYYSASVDEMERMLDPQLFYRTNRQFLVNRNAILNAERYLARKIAVKLSVEVPETIVVGKTKLTDFLKWLEES